MTTTTETRPTTMDCPRCGGSGRYSGYGLCYRCHGRGTVKYRKPAERTHYATAPDYSTLGRNLPAVVRRALLEIVERDDDVAVGAAHWLQTGDEKNARVWLDTVAPGWEDWT